MNSRSNYRQQLQHELQQLHDSELWQVGKVVRQLRPENVRIKKCDLVE